MKNGEFVISFGSEVQYLDIVQSVSDTITELVGFGDDARYWIGMSLRESVTNAVVHGNRNDAGKTVEVRFLVGGGKLTIAVKDEGDGFDESKLPDPLDPSNLLKPNGRGVFYMKAFMDEVCYERLPQGGLEVRMEKRLNQAGTTS